ncbi:MAG: dedA [Deltaproteobacteria bacterium]|nr:dedA [Deltaproteobacteria bacterium]
MEILWDLFHRIYDVEFLVRTGGLLVLIVIVFIETGLLVGFFLPGDSLLVTAGIFAARGDLDLLTLNITLSLAAIAGDTVGLGSEPARGAEIFHQGKFVLLQSQASHFGEGVL